MVKYKIYSIVTIFVLLALFSWMGQLSANNDVLTRQADPQQWPVVNGNYSTNRFSKLDQINELNAKNLKLAWSFDTTVPRGHEGAPLVLKGVPMGGGNTKNLMFFVTPYPNKVFALDLDATNATGQPVIQWKLEENQINPVPLGGPLTADANGFVTSGLHNIVCCDVVNRGVAYAQGNVYFTTLDGRLFKVDAATGTILKQKFILVDDEDPNEAEPLGTVTTQSPLVAGNKILVGMSGGEYGARGWLEAWNLDLTERQWRAYTSGPDSEMLVNTTLCND